MIALVSAFVGFLGSAAPEFIRLFREGKDRAHEIALLKLQMQFDQEKQNGARAERTAESVRQLQAIELQRDAADTVALNARVKDSLVGIVWVDALAGSVRPVLTYVFFLLYAAVKLAQFHVLAGPSLPWHPAMDIGEVLARLWTEDDMALFTAVIAFWFGQRAMGKRRAV